jgi:hypothetical protein
LLLPLRWSLFLSFSLCFSLAWIKMGEEQYGSGCGFCNGVLDTAIWFVDWSFAWMCLVAYYCTCGVLHMSVLSMRFQYVNLQQQDFVNLNCEVIDDGASFTPFFPLWMLGRWKQVQKRSVHCYTHVTHQHDFLG